MNLKLTTAPVARAFLCLWTASSLHAQSQPAANMSTSSDYVCVQRGPHSRIWQRTVLQTNESGMVRTNLHSYTELATGICYPLQNGQYADSVEEIDPVANGAQAIQGRYQVQWAANANTQGAVNLTTPDGKTLSSTVFGLTYYDTSTGSNMLLAQVQDSTATISSNTLTYANAFSNLIADIKYVYRKAGLSQDIVLRQQPPSPAEYGMNPATTYLQVLTEFFNPPAPAITAMTNNGLADQYMFDFGDMKMGVGHAFLFQSNNAATGGVPVTKIWTNIDNRTFLIEEVPYTSISNALSSLHSSVIRPDKNRVRRTVSVDRAKPHKVSTLKPAHPVGFAKTTANETGLVLDYELLSSTTNLTLRGDTTYLMTGGINVAGTLTIEGGTVVKYTNTPSAQLSVSNIVCQTGPYRPGVFTSMNDNSVGETINGSTGVPGTLDGGGYLCPNLYGPPLVLSNLRFSYAAQAIWAGLYDNRNSSIAISDCQFLACATVIDGYLFYTYSGTNAGFPIYLHNVLFSKCGEALSSTQYRSSEDYFFLNAVNITADQVGHLVAGGFGTSNVCYATNSIFTAVTNLEVDSSFDCYTNASSGGVYQTVGAGSYYLETNFASTNQGTTDIDPGLLADLQRKTVYPPTTNIYGVFTTNYTISYTFSPQVQRDNNGSTLAIGYHYDPMDYALNISLADATATVLPGTTLATYGSSNGVVLNPMTTFNCIGTAINPNYIVRYNTVQEQATTNWETANWNGSIATPYQVGYSPSSGNFRFTKWSVLAADVQLELYDEDGSIFTFQDCEFYDGEFLIEGPAFLSTNCLFQRVNMVLFDLGISGVFVSSCNNLFFDGELTIDHQLFGGGIWTFRDTLFDQTDILSVFSPVVDICSNNAYVTTNFGFVLPTNNMVILTNSPAYECGTLGEYYYPADQTNLIHAGSQLAAAAGLYHYTVTTNNVVEGTNTVSIGFHYVACGTDGLPLDSNGDGVPDYLEDANGDGIVDDGETNWALAILSQPLSQTVDFGSNATFTVGADGVAPLVYQWIFNGTNIPGATESSYTITDVQATNFGSYEVVVTNFSGSETSSIAVLTVAPQIVSTTPQGPGPTWINYPATFSVWATNSDLTLSPFSYAWQFDGTNIAGATSSNYTIAMPCCGLPLPATDEGNYTVTITNAVGSNSVTWAARLALPGMVETWGDDAHGESDRPVSLANATAIAAGDYHSVAVTDSGTVLQWGDYSDGTNFYAVGSPPSLTNAVIVAASRGHDLALLANGWVTNWGLTNDIANSVPPDLTNVSAIAAGWYHNLALSNGTVVAWGDDSYGQTNVPGDLTNAIAIAAGELFSIALRSNGTVEAWGDNTYGQTNVPSGLTGVVAIAAGGQHCLALNSNGTVVAWGNNDSGQTNVPAGMSNVMAIAAGAAHSVALQNDGTLVAWGDNTNGQTTVPAEAPTSVIEYFGTFPYETNTYPPIVVKLIAAGGDHTMAAIFSPLVQYSVDVSKDLLLIYNTNSQDSSNVCQYYLTHRPMVSNANVLGIGVTTNDPILPTDFTNIFLPQVQNWLSNNPTKRPLYVVLFQNVPEEVDPNTNTEDTAYPTQGSPSVQYQLHYTTAPGWSPFVTTINMNGLSGTNFNSSDGTNDCIAYIDKLVTMASNNPPGTLFISATTANYGNTNWYFDFTGDLEYPLNFYILQAQYGVTNVDPTASVFGSAGTNLAGQMNYNSHATNVAGYLTVGANETGDGTMFVDGWVQFFGDSGWYVMTTFDSFNGQRITSQANYLTWFASNAFDGTNYSNTPVGAITTVDEPNGVPNTAAYYGAWASGKSLAISAWAAQRSQYFQAVGDPFVRK